MTHRLLRATLALLSGLALAACGRENGIIVAVIAPDGGDPFVGPDAATQARVTLQNDAGTTVLADVGAGGAFQIDIRPQDNEVSRLRVEALRGTEVIAIGMTPPALWSALQGHIIPVLMQYRDSLTPGPVAWVNGHADFELIEIEAGFVGVFTNVSGANNSFRPEVYDLLDHGRAGDVRQEIQGEFDGDSTVAIVGSSRGGSFPYLLRGSRFSSYSGRADAETPAPADTIHSDRADAGIVRSTAIRDVVTGGGWIMGGRDANGPVARVDHYDNGFVLDRVSDLIVPRVRPQVIQLFPRGSSQPVWLVAGGNPAGTAFLETYSPDARNNRTLDLGEHDRRDASVVCIASDEQGCLRLLVVGGRVGSALATDSLVLDGAAIRTAAATFVTATGPALVHPRAGASAAYAEGGAVVIAGGDDDAGAVTSVEMINVTGVTTALAPPGGSEVGTTCARPAMLAVSNGSVMIAGGTHPDGTACTGIAFFRH